MIAATPFLAELRGVLAGRPEIELAMLFGSRARGVATPGSDADVAVLGSGLDLLSLAADLTHGAQIEVDVADLARAGFPLLQAILRDGIFLHESRPGAAARWRTRAILETDRSPVV